MITGKVEVDMSAATSLKQSLVNRILRKAVSQAGAPVRAAVKANAQSIAKTGGLAKSMGFKLKTYPDGVCLIIGPKSDYVKSKGTISRGPKKGQPIRYVPSRIAKLVESGTRRSKPRPFLGPAYQSQHTAFMERLAGLIAQGIAEQLSKS